jgi:hypothetical protein
MRTRKRKASARAAEALLDRTYVVASLSAFGAFLVAPFDRRRLAGLEEDFQAFVKPRFEGHVHEAVQDQIEVALEKDGLLLDAALP